MRAFLALGATVLAAVALGVALEAATVSSPAITTPTTTIPGVAIPNGRGATAGATAFATQVANLAPIPPGTRPLSPVPHALERAPQTPGVPGLVDRARVLACDRSIPSFERYVERHLPPGAHVTGSFTTTSGTAAEQVETSGIVVSLSTTGPNDYLAELDYEFLATASGLDVRLDAQTVFVPTRTDERIGTTSVVELTGYGELSLARGPAEPVTVTLGAAARAALVRVLNDLPAGVEAECMESVRAFRIRITTRAGTTWTFSQGCAGAVLVTRGAAALAPLSDAHCTLERAVAADLPKAARATRAAAADCAAAQG